MARADSTFLFRFRQLASQIWITVSAFSLLSVLTALCAIALGPLIPEELAFQLGADAVETVLSIVATSMLTVATFSLGIMANAISGAADGATPRASSLMLEDRVSQTALATFLGAFVFALVGIIALQVGVYGNGGRIILLGMTILVIVLIYTAFIRWVNRLRTFGRIPDTLEQIEKAASDALERRLELPFLGCHRLDEVPDTARAHPIFAPTTGFVQHIDVTELQCVAEKHDLRLYIQRGPGRFTSKARPLAYADKPLEAETVEAITCCFTVGAMRTFRQDPQFGMIVLAETASRALSPAVNDPGTAIDVLRRALRVLSAWDEPVTVKPKQDRLWMPPVGADDMLQDLLRPIARDGAALVEVHHVLQSLLRDLTEISPAIWGHAAHVQSKEALARAEAALMLDADKQELRAQQARIASASLTPSKVFM